MASWSIEITSNSFFEICMGCVVTEFALITVCKLDRVMEQMSSL